MQSTFPVWTHAQPTQSSCWVSLWLKDLAQNYKEKDGYGRAVDIHSNMIITELIDIDVYVCSNVVSSPAFPANGPMGDTNTV